MIKKISTLVSPGNSLAAKDRKKICTFKKIWESPNITGGEGWGERPFTFLWFAPQVFTMNLGQEQFSKRKRRWGEKMCAEWTKAEKATVKFLLQEGTSC